MDISTFILAMRGERVRGFEAEGGEMNWTQKEALDLCTKIEMFCPKAGCHVALTGGLLYKEGSRKDCDILFYRIRQVKEINMELLWGMLEALGIKQEKGFGWCFKASFQGKQIDVFFPEEQQGEYAASYNPLLPNPAR